MAATLVAFFALGFFAATLLTLARFLALVGSAIVAVFVTGLCQGVSVLHDVGLSCASFGLAQVGFGIGLAWMATTRSRFIPD